MSVQSDKVGKLEDPRAVVNLILKCGRHLDLNFSNLAIQKLLYFSHATYLIENRKPLVAGVFEAWEHGPVCRVVYDALKGFGRSPVTTPIHGTDIFTGEKTKIPSSSRLDVVAHVYMVTKTLGKLTPSKLRNLSHVAEGPWDYVWNKSETSVTLNNRITDAMILSRFRLIPVAGINSDDLEFDGYEATPFNK